MAFQRAIRSAHLCLLMYLCGLLTGCGGGDHGIVAAKGVVTFKGAPIGKIAVVFTPADGKGAVAEGTTDENGHFQLQTLEPGDGAMVGNYQVSFRYVSDVIPDMPGFVGGKKAEPSPIPAKYGDPARSGFTATVDADPSKNDFKFDLN